ncbi:hypothetical protein GRI62_05835 [Erythrobacter arachoides]|uniref:Putative Flp pilus-assembly TadG-like N-terminal domain-containing protein n=1 Tax=Aurantiacibacter arachoides TaxID=1850444 RepID=A0A845A1W2_9SPHN|nr:pilus assembly protein TadG-related protein [Aurantiacibacter arachoides]MXO93126.1 hypothetical protein [Aurantiacibacter arachoides]GGD51835.1 hypothetical protein GCM10011411_09590 [Aurantiacibacter arachoides]
MVRNAFRKTITRLTGCDSGNATLLVALGMPMLIGGAGLGVDVTQWYMWKRELQFAVDQAAVAGAWAAADEDTASTYQLRAQQEFDANMQVVGGFADEPEIQLADYASGNDNSVAVAVTAYKPLPFTSILTDATFPVSAYAQASFEEGTTFTSCLIALDDDDYGAITIGGNSVLTASCGLAALSTDAQAITVNGNPTVDAGWILSAGGIDQWLKDNTDDVIMEYMSGLYDPYEELQPPTPSASQIARTYSCGSEPDTTMADVSVRRVTEYSYWMKANKSQAWNNPSGKPSSTVTAPTVNQQVANGTQAGSTTGTPTVQWIDLGGSGNNKKWEKVTTTTTTTYSNVVVTPGAQAGSVRPGTYTDIQVRCNTSFAPGVYNIVGGGLKITGQYEVTGSAVMFVLYDGAYIDVAGGSDVNLTAMQASDLMAVGVAAEDANKLAGMLVFEDRDSQGSGKTKLNGNANTVLNGTLYFPISNVQFAGTVGVTSQCLMIAANNITITGTTNMTTFCPAGSVEDTTVASTEATVRLVA